MSNYIISLKRQAVKLFGVSAAVFTLAALGNLNIPAVVGGIIALNAACGLWLKGAAK